MSTSHACNHKKRRYRYYRCRASQEGVRCPTGLLNANPVEAAVVAPVKALAKSGALRVTFHEPAPPPHATTEAAP